MVADKDRAVAVTENPAEEKNNNQVSAESLKAANDHHKQEIAHLT